jgi:putative ABC transport system permease protein
MLRNYLTIAFRNLRKYRFYSLINIAGLTVGMTCFLFIFLYVVDESSFDAYHSNIDRLYRLNFMAKVDDQLAHLAESPKPAGPTFKQEVPEIEAFCRLQWQGNVIVRYDNQVFNEDKGMLADSSLFRVFSFPLLEGDAQTALVAPNSLVLSRSVAEKYFGSASPIGKSLKLNDQVCRVTGVMADMPKNTHFQASHFQSLSSQRDEDVFSSWGDTNTYNYFLLRKDASVKLVSEKISAVFVEKFAQILKAAFNSSWEDFKKGGDYARVELFPVRDLHLHSKLDGEPGVNGDVRYVYIFSIIGLFILALACVNFMNLATARAAIRAKEVGVRKAVGALRIDLAGQFLSESILMSLVALVLALLAVWLLLPAFNELSNKEMAFSTVYQPGYLLLAFGLAALMGILAGSYPAFFLSAFQPIKVLKSGGTGGGALAGSSGSTLRSGLVVFQFFTTVVLLIGSLVIYQQLEFIRSKKLGFNKENVLVLNNAYWLDNQLNSFKERVLQNPAVRAAAYCNALPAVSLNNSNVVYKGRNASQENSMLVNNWWGDRDYVKTMDMDIVFGRDFSKEMATDSSAVIVNETLAKSFGYPQQSILGKEITIFDKVHHIVGVVKDFNFSSLRNSIEPLAIYQGGYISFLTIRFETDQVDELLKSLRGAWAEMAPGKPFEYHFLDDRFDELYAVESRTEKIIGIFAALAIFIACMGLFGLATFMTEQRRKEIGVRKVLGASTAGIVGLLSKDFLKLVLLALVIASPLAWYAMDQWLENFAYRIDIQWTVFVWVGLAALAIAFLTISFQSIKAALANPVKSLKAE